MLVRTARLGRLGSQSAPRYTPALMSPLQQRTIATVGSGVMAEAMIAGLLRGKLVTPEQVVASHPRAERREALAREYGIRTVASNVEAVEDADVILFGIKPQMLGRVGREIGPHLRRGQLVLSVLAGATTAALTGLLGHDQVVRSMPNTPARLGKGMTVWYATPETTEEQRAQAAALLGALGAELEVDDEKFVAMATAVSGTGPTYVFLVMEALIDAAVHLGFPRHVAHDLVIETLEGSTLFAKQSGMHPAELRNMVTSPGGTSAAALHELESGRLRTVLSEAVWAAYRRTVELGDQLEASVDGPADARERPRRAMTERDRHGPATRAAGRGPRGRPPLRDARPLGRRGRPVRPTASPRGPGSTTPPGMSRARPRPMPAGRTGRSPSTSATSPTGRKLATAYTARRHRHRARGRPTRTSTTATSTRYNERYRAPWATMPRDEILERLDARSPRAARRWRPPDRCRDPRRRAVGLGLHDPPRPLPGPCSGSSSRGRTRCASARSTATRSSTTRDPRSRRVPRRRTTAIQADFDRLIRTIPADRWRRRGHHARLDLARPRRAPRRLDGGGPPGARRLRATRPLAGRPRRGRRRLERPDGPRPPRQLHGGDAGSLRRDARGDAGRGPDLPMDDLRSPDGWSWAYDCLYGHTRKHLALLGPWCAAQAWPAGPDLMATTAAPTSTRSRPDDRGRSSRSSRRASSGSTRATGSSPTRPTSPARASSFTLNLRGGYPDPGDRVGEGRLRSAVVARRSAPGVRPRRGDLGHRGGRLAVDPGRRQARWRHASRAGRRTAAGSAFLSRRRGWSQIWVIDAPVPRRGRPANDPKPPVARAVTATGLDVDSFAWAPDGTRLAVMARHDPTHPFASEIAIVDVATGASEIVAGDRWLRHGRAAGWPTARSLYVTDASGWFQVVRRSPDGRDRSS